MAASVDDSNSAKPSFVSASNPTDEGGDFECNICFGLAQDPIVTLCGHLFCWPCLYKWLHLHSQSQECPVCKALVQEDKVVPLYGRGKSTTDPRSIPVPGVHIPSRPSGQRPETAPSPAESNHGFGLLGGFIPIAATTTIGGGSSLFPGVFNFLVFHGFPSAAMYGAPHGFPYGHVQQPLYGGNGQGGGVQQQQRQANQGQDSLLKWLLVLVGFFVIFALCSN